MINSLRFNKLINLKNLGFDYPNNFRRNFYSQILHKLYGDNNNIQLNKKNIIVSIAGRIINRRIMGKITFLNIKDNEGYIQLYIYNNNINKTFYKKYFLNWDIGDIIGASGKLFKTKTGELSINCSEICLLNKCLHDLPDKFHGLINKEIKYSKRYLDLITNNNSINKFKIRSNIINIIRNFLRGKNFLEVETPILHIKSGGAIARPFVTYNNTLNKNMYLRIAPELFLKKLIIGGLEKIFELNKSFRNEGISYIHNPEFTMLELYIAYIDYNDIMLLLENLLKFLNKKINNKNYIYYKKYKINFNKPFLKMTMLESIHNYIPNIKLSHLNNLKNIKNIANNLNINIKNNWTIGQIQNEIFEKYITKYLIQPTFITDYPLEVSPLAKINNINNKYTERFELYILGNEISNGYSELNDPIEQKIRLINKNNILFDQEYITALEYGLPPTAGLGIGIDRLIMLLTNTYSIKDIIFFPIFRK